MLFLAYRAKGGTYAGTGAALSMTTREKRCAVVQESVLWWSVQLEAEIRCRADKPMRDEAKRG